MAINQSTFISEKSLFPFEGANVNEIRRNDFFIKPYLKRSNARAIWQVITTIVPISVLWLLVEKIDQSSLSMSLKGIVFIAIFKLLPLFHLIFLKIHF